MVLNEEEKCRQLCAVADKKDLTLIDYVELYNKRAELKERNDIPELKFATHSFGVRKTESVKRASHRDSIETRDSESFGTKSHQMFHFDKAAEVKQTSSCYTNKYFIVNPIAYWTEEDVWDYIHKYGIEYNPLYDKGFS